MSSQLPSNDQCIPKWVYALIVLIGPPVVLGSLCLAFWLGYALIDVMAKFDYWWAVGVAAVYLALGFALAECIKKAASGEE